MIVGQALRRIVAVITRIIGLVPGSRVRPAMKGYVTLDESWRDVSPICRHCRHLHFPDGDRVCGAFPDGIPKDIWNGENDHTKPYPGDHGIRFAALTPEDVEAQRQGAIKGRARRDQESIERLERIKAERRRVGES